MDEEQKEAEAPPAWFDDFKNQLGNALGTLNQQQQELASRVSQSAQPQPAAAPQLSKDTDEKLLNDFVSNPSRFISELDEVITRKATDHAEKVISDAEANRRTEEAARKFENDFFSENPELMPYRALVIEKMQTQAAHLDPMARANGAAVEVRKLLKNEQANAIENERRQRVSALRAGGAAGYSAAVSEAAMESPQSEHDARMDAFSFERDQQHGKL